MFSVLALCSHIYLIACLASILRADDSVLRLPPSTSMADNRTIGAWPTRLPWKLHISRDLSMDVEDYGEYAPPALWDEIKLNLDEIQHRIGTMPELQNPTSELYRSSYVSIYFVVVDQRGVLPAMEMAKIIEVTKGLFFVYKDNPREFDALIKLNEDPLNLFHLHFGRSPEITWPQLPWRSQVTRNLRADFYLYGRDLEASLLDSVDNAFRLVVDSMRSEGSQTDHVDHKIYSRGFVRLILEPSDPAKVRTPISRAEMISLLVIVRDRYHKHGPREIGAQLIRLMNPPRPSPEDQTIGTLFILFTDLDTIERV